VLLANDDAWGRVSLVTGESFLAEPPRREACAGATVYCRDFQHLSQVPRSRVEVVQHRSSWRVTLPLKHPGGRLFVSEVTGPRASALVDGIAVAVQPYLEAFGTVQVPPDARAVEISTFRKDRMILTLIGIGLMLSCLAVMWTLRESRNRPSGTLPQWNA
jgi:hypothetical protein